MKVGLIIYGSLGIISGGYLYDKKLVEYLQLQGVTVKVFSQSYINNASNFSNNFCTDIIKKIRDFSPDILLQDEMNYCSLYLLNRYLKRNFNFPIVSIVHHLRSSEHMAWIKKIPHKIIEKTYLNGVDGFIFNSHTTKTIVADLTTIKDKKNIVVWPGKDRIKLDISAQEIVYRCKIVPLKIIFIGNLIPRKGLHVLVETLAKIPSYHWRLTIIGGNSFDQHYAAKIESAIIKLNLTKNINLLGQINNERMHNEIISSHILAVPSYYEGFGIVYSEAMCAGLTVIASKSGGAREIISNNNGFLIKPRDVEYLKTVIEQLINNRDLLKRMSLASYMAATTLPTWHESMHRIHDFLLTF